MSHKKTKKPEVITLTDSDPETSAGPSRRDQSPTLHAPTGRPTQPLENDDPTGREEDDSEIFLDSDKEDDDSGITRRCRLLATICPSDDDEEEECKHVQTAMKRARKTPKFALHIAAAFPTACATSFFLGENYKPNAVNDDGETALDIAYRLNNEVVVQKLAVSGVNFSPKLEKEKLNPNSNKRILDLLADNDNFLDEFLTTKRAFKFERHGLKEIGIVKPSITFQNGEIGTLRVNRLEWDKGVEHTWLLVVTIYALDREISKCSARFFYGSIAKLSFAGGAPSQDGRLMKEFAKGLMAYVFEPKENSEVIIDLRSEKGNSVISGQIVIFEKIKREAP